MYRHKNLMASAGGSGGRPDHLGEPPNLPDDPKVKKNFVMLHGYNVDPNEARGWQAEFFKRLFWSGSRARFYGVTWHGAETKVYFPNPEDPLEMTGMTLDYHLNVEHAFATSVDLAIFLHQLADVGETTVAAHSLGNMVASAAIEDWGAPVANYFMMNAAVALEAYDASESRNPTSPNHDMVHRDWDNPGGVYKESLRASQFYTLFPEEDHRRSLTWRGRFGRVVPNMRVWNYHSTGEEVLAAHPQHKYSGVFLKSLRSFFLGFFTSRETSVEFARYVWAEQEKNKGRGLTILNGFDLVRAGSSDVGGWGFNEDDYLLEDGPNEGEIWPPDLANQIHPQELAATPFFNKGQESALYGPQGSEYARTHRTRLLAEMIPARSLPAGANNLNLLDDKAKNVLNPDMNTSFKDGWPNSRGDDGAWRHSDITDVAFPYVFRAYRSFVSNGSLSSE
jgi:hypothetical protein